MSLVLSLFFVLNTVGGGISGTFVTKYLTDYDDDCKLECLTLFDPLPLGQYITKDTPNDPSWQGSRIGTYRLEDGRIVELGASIMTDSFSYILEMARAGNLTIGKPFATGVPDENIREGMVIYSGNGENVLNTANTTSFWKKINLLGRYNLDLWKISRATTQAIDKFHQLQAQLRDDKHYFFNSPQEMWEYNELQSLVETSLDDFCESVGVYKEVPWWRYFLPSQGSLRNELLSAINLVNYNQDTTEINALSGLASFSVSSVKFYGIQGGNAQIVKSAFEQAQANHQTKCPKNANVVSHLRRRISTVVGSLHGFELYDKDGSLIGEFDQVVLSAPMAMSRVEFLVRSHIDESVLQPMPLGGLVPNSDDSKTPNDHEGHAPLPVRLPKAVTRPYTQVVTTLVRNAQLQIEYFSIDPEHVPRGIYMTPKGKAAEYNVTSIAQIASQDDIYKVFSSQPLTREVLTKFFGPNVEVEYEKKWGGQFGGATPQYQGRGDTTTFLLYDGATGFHGHTKSGALYFPNALELTFACIELSAMGAKAVAKLLAKRLQWITPANNDYGMGEEL